MKRRLWLGGALGFAILALSLIAAPSTRADDAEVSDRIKAIEQELEALKAEQIELKKEATEAAAALPTFGYRPGNGLLIEAANKAWSMRTSMQAHIRWNFLSGRDEIGRTQGEVLGRRFRLEHYFCVNNCLWEIEAAIDLDGFGGGNAKNSTGTGVGSLLQRGVVHFHAENLHPWLPTLTAGMDISATSGASVARQGSSATGSQREYDMLTRNTGPNTGSSGNGVTLTWDDRSLTGIGIPGRISRFQVGMANVGEGSDGLSAFTDRKDFTSYIGIQPFRNLKNKWLRGLMFETGAWFCNVDGRPLGNGDGNTDNACHRMRIRDHGDAARQTLYNTGTDSIGKGTFYWVSPGFIWQVGPYRLRVMGGFAHAEDKGGDIGKKRANVFLIGHDLYIWSPKGFLTGSANTPGSILLGTHFERNNLSCGDRIRFCDINSGDFHRIRVLLREWDIWYVIMPRMAVGVNVLWYDASNLRNGVGQEAHNLGICSRSKILAGGCRNGTSGDWVDWSLTWRYQF